MKIELMTEAHFRMIFDFEVKNKIFFEQVLPARPEGYFDYEIFKDLMTDILAEQAQGLCYMHVILNSDGLMVGRINLQREAGAETGNMELGYRIDGEFQGKGLATASVAFMIELAKRTYGLSTLVAGTDVTNIGSRRVLEKNGFMVVGEEKDVMVINGRSVDGVLYVRAL